MSLSQSPSPVSSQTSPNYENDLFKKFKLKHHLTIQSTFETDDQLDMNNSDEWTSKSTTPELDVEPHFENYYTQKTSQLNHTNISEYLLTPDIEELQRKENELVQALNVHQQDFEITDSHTRTQRDQHRPHMQCGVCHDRATGVHYGLATCEGCKGKEKFTFLFLLNRNCFFFVFRIF